MELSPPKCRAMVGPQGCPTVGRGTLAAVKEGVGMMLHRAMRWSQKRLAWGGVASAAMHTPGGMCP